MSTSHKRINLLLWITSGIVTNFLYVIIVLLLLQGPSFEVYSRQVLEVFLPLIGLSFLFAIIIIINGIKHEKEVNWDSFGLR